MAKQNVTFIERHVEKIVVGVCGAVLAAAVAMYGARSPNRVTVGGESLGPNEFYRQVRESGEAALKTMQNAHPPDTKQKDDEIKKVVDGLKPPDYGKIPEQILVAFALPSPPVPGGVGPIDGKKDLAEILAPSKPLASAGRAAVKLPPLPPIMGDPIATGGTAQPVPAESEAKDIHWVTLAATINRKGQREKFTNANYNQDHMALLIMGIEAQRQMRLPGGEWGPIEKVEAYSPVVAPPTLTLQIPDGEDAVPFIPVEQLNLLDSFAKKIGDYSLQSELFLRPPFQKQLLSNHSWWWEWSIPRKLEGVDGDLSTDNGVLYPDEILPKKAKRPVAPAAAVKPLPKAAPAPVARGGGRGEGGGAAPAPAAARKPAPTPEDQSAGREVMDDFKKGDKALDENNPITADKFYQLIVDMPNAPAALKSKAQKKLDEIKPLVEVALKEKDEKEKRRQEQMRLNFGPDVDPVWLTDISVLPGKTYRYQIRLRALNAYAGLPDQLNHPKDAEVVERPGEWSEWSDPIATKPDKEVFVYGLENDKTAQIEIQRWTGGDWRAATAGKVGIGEPIVAKSGRLAVPYDGTIASIDPNRPYRERVVRPKDNVIEYKDPVPTAAVVLVNGQGEVHEHLVKEDFDRRNRFNDQKKKEADRIHDLMELQPNVEQPYGGIPAGRILGSEGGARPIPLPPGGGRNGS